MIDRSARSASAHAIPAVRPDVGPEESAAVADVPLSGSTAPGPRVDEIEARWAAFVGVRHAVAVVNGTVARMSILAGLGIGRATRSSRSATVNATVSSILFTGASPVFVDIEPDTYLIDAARIEAAITARTRAIYPVHLYRPRGRHGHDQRHRRPARAGRRRGRGAARTGRRSAVVARDPGVTLRCLPACTCAGEGGLITTNDDRLADWIRRYRDHGRRGRQAEILGFDFRLSEVAAAIGLVGLDRLEAGIAARRSIASGKVPPSPPCPSSDPSSRVGRKHVFHRYTLGLGPARDAIAKDLWPSTASRRLSSTPSRSIASPTCSSGVSTPTCRLPTPRPRAR